MKVIVVKEFRDIDNFDLIHKVGDIIDVDDARGQRLVEIGVADSEKAKPTDKAETETAAPDLQLETPEPTPEPKRRRSKE